MSVATASPHPRLLDDWLDEPDAAPEVGLKPSTLTSYRKQGKGPRFSRIGRKEYHRFNLRAWLEAGGTLVTHDTRE
jgi:hypothetical protein